MEPITNDAEHDRAIAEIDRIFATGDDHTPAGEKKLEQLGDAIWQYEETLYPDD